LSRATIVSGASDAARALITALVEQGDALIWLGGEGERAGAVSSLGDPDDAAAWDAAVALAGADHGGIARVLNLLVNPAPRAVLEDLSYDGFDAAFLSTLGRTFAAQRATIPAMRDGGGGRFLTIWEQQEEGEADGLVEPVCTGGLELCTRVIAKEYAEAPTVNVNLVLCRSREVSLDVLRFWWDYLGGEAGAYVTGANIGRPAH
jgi:NAD(P)-dependent dehydrogenase (short-subunit alcohol dehydrogenase family)